MREELLPALSPYGFTCEGSSRATFHRRLTTEVYHLIAPDRFWYRQCYDIWIFAAHPSLCDFGSHFPDSLPILTGPASKLRVGHGVDVQGSTFSCANEMQLRAGLRNGAIPAVLSTALPYLDTIRCLEDLRAICQRD